LDGGGFAAALAIALCGGARTDGAPASSAATAAGQVTDQQSAAVAGAEVRLMDTATNLTTTTLTNDTGRYVFVNVPSGTFNLEFSRTGFAVYRVSSQLGRSVRH
jgi:hypothetical protein